MPVAPPMALLAELTHRCPLRCPYCSNPIDLLRASDEMPTVAWCDIFAQAARLGVLQLHLSGGEPMVRSDLVELVAQAATCGLYTNLITSGVQLDQERLNALLDAGLDHIQLSFQAAEADAAERIGGMPGAHARKLAAARLIQASGLPLTLNFVVHRQNLADLPQMLALAEELQVQRVEIAHTQFYGWGLRNRDALLPDAAQVDAAAQQVAAAQARNLGRMVIDYVTSDYHADRPKACMGGWGQRFMVIAPNGAALPCHAAQAIPGLRFASARLTPLADIWQHDAAFAQFRGTDWMGETCRGCVHREQDRGGCRCQAMALAGSAEAIDPVCGLSPRRAVVNAALAAAADNAGWVYRGDARVRAAADA